MSQVGYTPISLYYSATASNVPTAGNLVAGELAINTADGRLFYKDSAGVVQVIGTKGGVGSSSTTQVLYNSSGLVVGSAGLTFDGTNLTTTGTATATRFIPSGSTVATNGLYLPAANSIGISTNSTNAIYIDSGQNVGIGTSSPATKLEVSGQRIRINNASDPGLELAVSSVVKGYVFYDTTNNVVTVRHASSTGINMDSSGNVFIGGSSFANYKLGVYGDIRVVNAGYTMGGTYTIQASDVGIGREANGGMIFGTNGTERMRIDSSGNLLVSKTSPNLGVAGFEASSGTEPCRATKSGNATFEMNRLTSTGDIIRFYYNTSQVGSISTNGSTTAYNTTSDYRLKENVAPMTGALAKVQALKPVTYTWKATGEESQGFIAHELAEIVPDCVTGEKDAVEIVDDVDDEGKVIGTKEIIKPQGIDTSFLVATLTAAIQEQQAMIEELKAKVAALEAA